MHNFKIVHMAAKLCTLYFNITHTHVCIHIPAYVVNYCTICLEDKLFENIIENIVAFLNVCWQ